MNKTKWYDKIEILIILRNCVKYKGVVAQFPAQEEGFKIE